MNMSKTLLSFTLQAGAAAPIIPIGGATSGGAVWNYYMPLIKRLEFFQSDNVKLMDLNNVDVFSRLTGSLLLNYKKENGDVCHVI